MTVKGPPAAVDDLEAVAGTNVGEVELSWTAVGAHGSTGTASSYLVRYASSAISNQSNWDAATPVTTGVPNPQIAGSAEQMMVTELLREALIILRCAPGMIFSELGGFSNSPSSQPKSDPSSVCGTISTNTTWGSWADPYTITCNVVVAQGAILTIQPGTEIRFNSATGLTVNGTLLASGTSGSPIIFTANSASPAAGYWNGISIANTSRIRFNSTMLLSNTAEMVEMGM